MLVASPPILHPEHNPIIVVLDGQELQFHVCHHFTQGVRIHYQISSYHILNHTEVNTLDLGPVALPHVGHAHYPVGPFINQMLLMEIHSLREGRYILQRLSMD